MTAASNVRIGVEVGGARTEVLVMRANGEELFREQAATPRGSYGDILEAIVELVQTAEARIGRPEAIGIGIPGVHVRETGLIKNANITEFNGQPLWLDLERRLGRPMRLANDANCFALSEARDGAAAGCEIVFGVILDAGCGGGLVINGQVVGGRHGLTGEWGHNVLPGLSSSDGPALACYCGQRGCVETYISAPGFAYDYMVIAGRSLSPIGIAAAAASGEAEAIRACERLEERLARSLAGVINIVDPDCIVIGGELSHIERLYTNVPLLWQKHVFGHHVETKLVQAQHGATSGVRGAAWLWDWQGPVR